MNKKTLIWIGIGVVAILAYKHFTKPKTTSGAGEGTSNASGNQCGHSAAPSSFTADSPACQRLTQCSVNGGNPSVTQVGSGYAIVCHGADISPITVNSSGYSSGPRGRK